MSTYKLYYYNIRGRAETSRMIFAQAGVAYEDIRFGLDVASGMGDEKFKASSPTGMMPVLEVDGKQLVGSGVIARFLGERFGMAGSNDIENAELAGIMDVMDDYRIRMIRWLTEKEEEKKAALLKEFTEEHTPKYFGILEGICKKSDSDWIYGDKPTYVDLLLYNYLCFTLSLMPNIKEDYPSLVKVKAAVEALPNVAKWLKERPVTDH